MDELQGTMDFSELDSQAAEQVEQSDATEGELRASFVIKEELPHIIEAMIFASPEPLTCAKVKEAIERQGKDIAEKDIEEAFEILMARWGDVDRGIALGLELAHLAGGYVFRTRLQYGPFIRSLFQEKPTKLTPSQLEVLSIVAYRQPVTRVEIEDIRGVDCSASMRKLLGLRLVKILGKSQGVGRPLLYGTTKQFLEFFSLNSLHDLPTLKEYHELNQGMAPDEAEKIDGPISVQDLFAENDSMFSEDTEKLSEEAFESLEKAMGVVTNKSQQIDVEKILQTDVAD